MPRKRAPRYGSGSRELLRAGGGKLAGCGERLQGDSEDRGHAKPPLRRLPDEDRAAPPGRPPAGTYFGGKTANASTSTSHSALTRAITPTVERAGFTGLLGLLKNCPYASFHPCVSIVPPFSLSGTR